MNWVAWDDWAETSLASGSLEEVIPHAVSENAALLVWDEDGPRDPDEAEELAAKTVLDAYAESIGANPFSLSLNREVVSLDTYLAMMRPALEARAPDNGSPYRRH